MTVWLLRSFLSHLSQCKLQWFRIIHAYAVNLLSIYVEIIMGQYISNPFHARPMDFRLIFSPI